MLTQKRLHYLLRYDPKTGEFTRNIARPGYRAGTKAGSITSKGYIEIKIDGRSYLAHRLAWFYTHGRWPKQHLDHRDRVPSNIRLGNLREANKSLNGANVGIQKNNTCGFKGVCRDHGKFRASIRYHGKRRHLGTFRTAAEAHIAYVIAAKKLFGDFHCAG